MRASGLVVDQSLQPNAMLNNMPPPKSSTEQFPTKEMFGSSTQSYSAVVGQAVITQDKPLLKEILIQCDLKTITNSVAELEPSRINDLLNLLEELLSGQSLHAQKYCWWIQQILTAHLGVVLSNHNSKSTVARIRKLLQKRMGERQRLLSLQHSTSNCPEQIQQKTKVARFSYQEGKAESKEEGIEMGELNEGDWLEDAMDDFDEE